MIKRYTNSHYFTSLYFVPILVKVCNQTPVPSHKNYRILQPVIETAALIINYMHTLHSTQDDHLENVVYWTVWSTASWPHDNIAQCTLDSRGPWECLMGRCISFKFPLIPIPIPKLHHVHSHSHGIPTRKWERGIIIHDADLYCDAFIKRLDAIHTASHARSRVYRHST